MSDSEWTVSSGYSRSGHYTESRDRRGFSTKIRVTVSPDIVGEVAELVASRRIPEYRTVHDFIRDAIIHQLRYVGEVLEDADLIAVADTQDRVQKAEWQAVKYQSGNQLYKMREQQLRDCRSPYTKAQILDECKADMAVMDEYWKAEMRRLISNYL